MQTFERADMPYHAPAPAQGCGTGWQLQVSSASSLTSPGRIGRYDPAADLVEQVLQRRAAHLCRPVEQLRD